MKAFFQARGYSEALDNDDFCIQVGKTRETARVCAALHSNSYPIKIAADVIRKKGRSPPPTPTPEELVGMFIWSRGTR